MVLKALDATDEAISPTITITMSATSEQPSQLGTWEQTCAESDHALFNAKAWYVCAAALAVESSNPVSIQFTIQDNNKAMSPEERAEFFRDPGTNKGSTYGPGNSSEFFSPNNRWNYKVAESA